MGESTTREAPTVVAGYAAVYHRAGDPGTEYELPGFQVRERIMPGAFDRALSDGRFITADLCHCGRFVLASTAAGTLGVWADATGLAFRLELPADHVSDHVAALVRGRRLWGGSFTYFDAGTRSRRGNGVCELHSINFASISLTNRPAYRATRCTLIAPGCDRGL